jgi:hypothetical protein
MFSLPFRMSAPEEVLTMARGDVRRIVHGQSVSAGVRTSISVTCNSNEVITGGGYSATDNPGNPMVLAVDMMGTTTIDTYQVNFTPPSSGTVNVIAHAIEV